MLSWNSREAIEHQVVIMSVQGMSKRAIARSLKISRNRVKRILKAHDPEAPIAAQCTRCQIS